ncbi:hypothetical protein WH87_04745 [Devosia epidermidihirudinis]|uniref:Uncharacterized protein n=1 Tax=Devosia epidermidihirudinis TaxID=1293439 RepID=A0A0F5QET5_9HYPH|nr:phage tail terminator-like protein [Devosia epidermidihirudinis]KKC39507.1 hypothetical protein WH87_04745 [Devosia epidermidihirudinis]
MSVPVEADIWAALKARVETLPAAIMPQSSIAYPKVAFTKPTIGGKPSPYIEVRHLPNQAQRLFINNGAHRRPGILQLSLYVPNAGSWTNEQTLGQAGRIAEHFPMDLKLSAHDVTVRISKAPDIAQGFADGAYWMTPISVSFDCFG